jgi:hypothetical protein
VSALLLRHINNYLSVALQIEEYTKYQLEKDELLKIHYVIHKAFE